MSDLIKIIFDERISEEKLSINEKYEKLEPFLKENPQILFFIHQETNPPTYIAFYSLVGRINKLVGREIVIDCNIPSKFYLNYKPDLVVDFLLHEVIAAYKL